MTICISLSLSSLFALCVRVCKGSQLSAADVLCMPLCEALIISHLGQRCH